MIGRSILAGNNCARYWTTFEQARGQIVSTQVNQIEPERYLAIEGKLGAARGLLIARWPISTSSWMSQAAPAYLREITCMEGSMPTTAIATRHPTNRKKAGA